MMSPPSSWRPRSLPGPSPQAPVATVVEAFRARRLERGECLASKCPTSSRESCRDLAEVWPESRRGLGSRAAAADGAGAELSQHLSPPPSPPRPRRPARTPPRPAATLHAAPPPHRPPLPRPPPTNLPQHRRPPHTSLPTASPSAPSRARQDGEFDDTLAWKLLHHLHRKRGSLDAFKVPHSGTSAPRGDSSTAGLRISAHAPLALLPKVHMQLPQYSDLPSALWFESLATQLREAGVEPLIDGRSLNADKVRRSLKTAPARLRL